MTSKPLGTATGSFSATYREGAIDDVPPAAVDLTLILGGESIDLVDVEASVSTFMFPGFGGGGPRRGPDRPAEAGQSPPPPAPPGAPGESPVSVVISGKRADDGKPLALNLFLDRRRVRDTDASLPVNGMITEGTSGFGIPGLMPMRSISGTFTPAERGLDPGERLGGTFSLEITKMEGGLMNQAPMKKPDSEASPAADAAATPSR